MSTFRRLFARLEIDERLLGMVASLIAMREGFVPATINLTHPDPDCDLDYVPLTPRMLRFDRFLTNSFGFGGQNACLAVQAFKEAS